MFLRSVSLHPTVLWPTYKRTQNNADGLRGTSICCSVILNLHLPLNTHHPPLNTHTYQDRVGPQQMVSPTKGRVRPVALVLIDTCTSWHRRLRDARHTQETEQESGGQLSEWGGLSSRYLASLIRRVTAEGLSSPSSEPSRAEKALQPPAWPCPATRGVRPQFKRRVRERWELSQSINTEDTCTFIQTDEGMKGLWGGGFTPRGGVVVGVRVTITKIKSLLNHDMKVECKCDD